MRVIRAEHAGACYGVKRALDMALEATEAAGEATTLGPLIHNPLVVADLERRGAVVADDVDAVTTRTVIIRSHGVTPSTRSALDARGLEVVDATCPHVARAQTAAGELAAAGCRVLVVGEKDHPEVAGLAACVREAGGKVDVVSDPSDVPEGLYDPIGVVVQTTQRRENLDDIVKVLRQRGLDPQVKNTICSATSLRQRAAAELAVQVDAMVVIGGRNSSNTTRLAEICASHCSRTFHIETIDEVDPASFRAEDTVGVTAGASTPEDQIAAVATRLEEL